MAGYQMAYQQPYGQYQQVYPGMQYGYGQNQYLNYGYGRQQYGYQRYW